ncbi:hypothetical protein RFI_19310, partial [Reticulomyxa filosa]
GFDSEEESEAEKEKANEVITQQMKVENAHNMTEMAQTTVDKEKETEKEREKSKTIDREIVTQVKTENVKEVVQDTETKSLIFNGRDLHRPLDSADEDSEEPETNFHDKIVCQYTQVQRNKNEWLVELKNGIMHINGKDYAFAQASNGNLRWSVDGDENIEANEH